MLESLLQDESLNEQKKEAVRSELEKVIQEKRRNFLTTDAMATREQLANLNLGS